MPKKKNKEIEVFGLSFMDLVSCALGGMLVIMLVFSTLLDPNAFLLEPSDSNGIKRKSQAAQNLEKKLNSNFSIEFIVTSGNPNAKNAVTVDLLTNNVEPIFIGEEISDSAKQFVWVINEKNKYMPEFQFEITNPSFSQNSKCLITLISNYKSTQRLQLDKEKSSIRLVKSGFGYTIEK